MTVPKIRRQKLEAQGPRRRRTLARARVLRRVVVLLAACAVLLLRGVAQGPPVTAQTLINALQKQDYPQAVRISSILVQRQPRSARLWTLRAVALEKTAHTKDALAAYGRALRLDANYLPALEGSAQLAYASNAAEAARLLHRVTALQTHNETAHAMLGALAYRQRSFEEAAEEFAQAPHAIATRPDALMEYGLSLAHLHRETEAVPLLARCVELDSTNAVARYDLALMQWNLGAAGDALSTLTPLLDAPAADDRALRLAAAIHEQRHETPQAVELLRAAILANPDDSANYLDFATLAFAHNSFDVGVDIVSRGIARKPDVAALYMARGVLYGQNGEYEKAMDDFEKAHTLDPENAMAATAEGIAESQHQNHAAALENFRRQVKEHPQDALGYYLLAEGLSWAPPEDTQHAATANAFAEAVEMAEKATALDPRLVQAWELRASLYLQANRVSDAVQASRKALELAPNDQQALYTLILALRKTGSKDELKSLVQQLTELRKQQGDESRKNQYGRLVEAP